MSGEVCNTFLLLSRSLSLPLLFSLLLRLFLLPLRPLAFRSPLEAAFRFLVVDPLPLLSSASLSDSSEDDSDEDSDSSDSSELDGDLFLRFCGLCFC